MKATCASKKGGALYLNWRGGTSKPGSDLNELVYLRLAPQLLGSFFVKFYPTLLGVRGFFAPGVASPVEFVGRHCSN